MHSSFYLVQLLAASTLAAAHPSPYPAPQEPTPTPTSEIENTISTGTISSAPPPTTAAPACAIVSSFNAVCGSRTPGFDALAPFASQASCLCYSSTAWAPNIYDQALQSCSQDDPEVYSSYIADGPAATLTGPPCSAVGNVAGAQAQITAGPEQLITAPFTANYVLTGDVPAPNTTLITGGDPNQAACTSYLNIRSACSSATPNFGELEFISRAECLCYDEGAWNATLYDGAAASCFRWYSTAAPREYASFLDANGGSVTTSPCHAFTTRGSPASVVALPSQTGLIAVQTTASTTTSTTASTTASTSTPSSETTTSETPISPSTGAAPTFVFHPHHAVPVPLLALLFSL